MIVMYALIVVMAAAAGVGPTLFESKSKVLPLNYAAIFVNKSYHEKSHFASDSFY